MQESHLALVAMMSALIPWAAWAAPAPCVGPVVSIDGGLLIARDTTVPTLGVRAGYQFERPIIRDQPKGAALYVRPEVMIRNLYSPWFIG